MTLDPCGQECGCAFPSYRLTPRLAAFWLCNLPLWAPKIRTEQKLCGP